MRKLLLTLAATATLLVGGMAWPDAADARPRWRGGYRWGGPAVSYYRPYRPYGAYYYGGWRRPYYSGYYYSYPSYYGGYYGYPYYRYSWGRPWWGGSGVYIRF